MHKCTTMGYDSGKSAPRQGETEEKIEALSRSSLTVSRAARRDVVPYGWGGARVCLPGPDRAGACGVRSCRVRRIACGPGQGQSVGLATDWFSPGLESAAAKWEVSCGGATTRPRMFGVRISQMGTKRASRSLCGVYDCTTCVLFREKTCPGCGSGNLHLIREGSEPCAVYQCVRALGVAGCHECTEQSCRVDSLVVARCPLRGRFGGPTEYAGFRELLDGTKGAAAGGGGGALAPRTLQRMGRYLRVAEDHARRGVATISSHQLGRAAGARSSLVRRDLSALGRCGTPGRGYAVSLLREAICRRLALEQARSAVWLGNAELAGRPETREALDAVNCRLVGVFDDAAAGRKAAGVRVQRLARAADKARKARATVAIVASEEAGQPEVVQGLVGAGVRAVLNLTPAPLTRPANVAVEQADLGSLLFRLLCQIRVEGNQPRGAGRVTRKR